jgi:predicted phage terminase large subunit-like protein
MELILSTEKNRLIITFPPRHGKSEYISKYLPAWYLLNYPSKQIRLTSYSSSFATNWSLKAKQVYTYFKDDLKIDRQGYWVNSSDGVMHATGVGGDITGRGADLFIIDDPVKNNEEALSTVYRDKTFEWFNSVAFTRLEPNAKIILIQTRWHNDDLAGRLLKSGKWELINFPAIDENNIPLWSDRYSLDDLNEIKNQIGSYWFAALYQQKPILSENQIIKLEWIKRHNGDYPKGTIIQSWDTAFDNKKHNDYSVCTTWNYEKKKMYLIDTYRQKLNFPDLLRNAKSLYDKFKPSLVLIEKKASGEPLIQSLRLNQIPLKSINPITDKVSRLHAVSGMFESGSVFFNESIKDELISELINFPYDANDDFVDSVSQALEYSKSLTNLDNILNYKPEIKETNYYKV